MNGRGVLVAETSVPRARAVVVGRQIRLVGSMRTHHAHAAEKTAMPRGQRRARTRDTRLSGAVPSARPTIGPGGSTWSGGWSSAGAEAAYQVRIPTIPNALAHAHDPTHRFSRKSVQAPRFLYSARGTWHPPLAWRAVAAGRARRIRAADAAGSIGTRKRMERTCRRRGEAAEVVAEPCG